MEVKNEKKVLALSFLGVITFIAVVVGATFAYFTAQSNGGANIDTNIITGTTDLLSFKFGDEINIQANQDNFGAGMGNLSDSTTGTALLRAGDTTNNVDATYNIYLIIEANDFEYTTEDQTPEILLNVTDPNGNPVENITGLVHYEDGFDITTRTGGFLLVPDYQISATNISETIQDWNIEVTFVNLDSDQNANTGKTLTGKLYMTQEQMSSYELTQINNIGSSTTYNSITVTPEITNGSGAVEKYYYGIEEATGTRSAETVEYIESDEPSHTFSNLQPNSSYTVYSYVIDENKVKSNVYQTNIATDEYENPIIDNVTHSVTLNSITVNVTASGGSNNVSKYMYKIDENDWVESESSSYTFTNLTDTTEYDIRIKVVDSENHESTEYYEAIITEVYILPVVASVDATTTWNSITLTPSGTNGTNTIDHYEYSINNGAYQTSNVFNGLNENTTYTIKVKAIDSIGRESNIYETTVRTDTYKLPTINNVTVSSDASSITINVSATGGDGSIVNYHYSRDDGSNYQTSNNNSYTFSGLTSGTTYYLKVYVTDSNGRTSSVYSTIIATESTLLADYITNLFEEEKTIESPDGYTYTLSSSTGLMKEDVYYKGLRYYGSNPKNYINFNEETWRIIGVFDGKVKITREETFTGPWGISMNRTISSNFSGISNTNLKYNGLEYSVEFMASACIDAIENNWENTESYELLNTTFYNSLSSSDQNMIYNQHWIYGFGDSDSLYAGTMSLNETCVSCNESLGNPNIYANVAMLLPSDYAFASDLNVCKNMVNNYSDDASNCLNTNWLYPLIIGEEWLLTLNADSYNRGSFSYYIRDGNIYSAYSGETCSPLAIRPTLYLKDEIIRTGGTGTKNDPYQIALS